MQVSSFESSGSFETAFPSEEVRIPNPAGRITFLGGATFNTKCYRRLRVRKETSRRPRIFCPAVQQMRSLVKICELRRSATGKKTFRKTGCGAVSVIAAWEQPIRLAPLSPRTSGGNSQKIRKSQVSAPEYPRQSIRGRADAKGKQARPRPEFRI